jgi:hypothetical protein
MANLVDNIYKIKKGKTLRQSSWEKNGRNADWWAFQPGETLVIADIKGPGKITHLWFTTGMNYREVLIKITWDNSDHPSILVPYGDFFCLGHGIVNSFQNMFFACSTRNNNKMNTGCAMNCYLPMPFRERAVVELVNLSKNIHRQYFYVDYELYDDVSELGPEEEMGYLHAEFHRENPFGGWGHDIKVNSACANIVNKEETAWNNNYVILETKGKGHYIGCNYSVTNFQGTWWGEGDDMIWVDGYKWPPDLHGTGSEDYLNQAWGMQDNAHLRNGSSIYEHNTDGYQTSYVFHVENPVRFQEEIKVTIEFGHGNHLRNEVSTVAYWYANKPTKVKDCPPREKLLPVMKDKDGKWIHDPKKQITSREIELNDEMKKMKRRNLAMDFPGYINQNGQVNQEESGPITMKIQFSRDNPTIYDIPLSEVLDFFINRENCLYVKLFDSGNTPKGEYSGLIKAKDDETLILVKKDGLDISMVDFLGMSDIKGKILEVEALSFDTHFEITFDLVEQALPFV